MKQEIKYDEIIDFLRILYTARGIEKSIATILYLSVPDEQDAFVTGFYGQAKRDFIERRTFNIQESYYKSELYAQTIGLKKAINEVLQHRDISKINEILKSYQTKDEDGKVIPLNHGKLIRLGNNALDRMEKKTAQIINRLNLFKFKNGFRPNVTKKIIYPGMPENDFNI